MSNTLYVMYSQPTFIQVGEMYVVSDENPRYVKDVSTLLTGDFALVHVFRGVAEAYSYKLKLIDYISEDEMLILPLPEKEELS